MARLQLQRVELLGVPFVKSITSSDIIVDCLFGSGLNKDLDETSLSIINSLNEQKAYTQKIFESYWKEGIDISDSGNLIQIVEELGFNVKKFDSFINSSGAKEQLKLNTNTLIKRGGFGSPTFFYKNMMFFGNDRIPLLESLIN